MHFTIDMLLLCTSRSLGDPIEGTKIDNCDEDDCCYIPVLTATTRKLCTDQALLRSHVLRLFREVILLVTFPTQQEKKKKQLDNKCMKNTNLFTVCLK